MSEKKGHSKELLSAMAFLHCEFMGRQQSNSFRKQPEHTITFVYDSDVINTYCAPWKQGPLHINGRLFGYGQLLPRKSLKQDDPDVLRIRAREDIIAWHTARLLAKKALGANQDFQLNENTDNSNTNPANIKQIFQFDVHFDETKNQEEFISNRLRNAPREENFTNADKLYRRSTMALVGASIDSGVSNEQLVKLISNRLETSFQGNYDGRTKFERGAENYRIFKNNFGEIQKFNEQYLERLFPNYCTPHIYSHPDCEEYVERILLRFWRDRLKQSKSNKTSPESIQSDAEALTQITLVNKRLMSCDIDHRVVFVTGDQSLVKATYDTNPKNLLRYINHELMSAMARGKIKDGGNVSSQTLRTDLLKYFGLNEQIGNREYWFGNFAYFYIRHFWAIAPDALIENENTKELQDLFHGLFATEGKRLHLSRRNIEKLILSERSGFNTNLTTSESNYELERWSKLTQKKIELARSEEFEFSNLEIESVRRHIRPETDSQQVGDVYETVYSLIDEFLSQQRDRTMLSFSDHGAQELVLTVKEASRPPDLFFRSLPMTNSIFQNLAVKGHYGKITNNFLEDFKAVGNDCFGFNCDDEFDDRQKSHLQFLVLSAAFAASEKWSAADGHAMRAIKIIERSKLISKSSIPVKENSNCNMSGREAYYISAVCRRMRADSKRDFRNAWHHIDKARNAWHEDIKEGDVGRNGEIDKARHDVRLKNEYLSNALAYYYFKRSNNPKGDPETFQKYADNIYEMVRDEQALFIKFMDKCSSDAYAEAQLTCDMVCLNVLQVMVIAKFRSETIGDKSNSNIFHQLCQIATERLNTRIEDPNYIETKLVKAYRKICSGLIAESQFQTFTDREETNTFFGCMLGSGNTSSHRQLSNYDRWRIRALWEFAIEYAG